MPLPGATNKPNIRKQYLHLSVKPLAVKCHLGRWTAQHEDDYPPWESIKKAPNWERPEWSSFRSLLARAVQEPKLATSDEAAHTMRVEEQISHHGEPITGAKVMFIHMVRRALPGAFTNRRFQIVWFVIGHSALRTMHYSIIYKMNEPCLTPAADPTGLRLEKACCCRAHLCQITTRREFLREATDSPAPSGWQSYLYGGAVKSKAPHIELSGCESSDGWKRLTISLYDSRSMHA